jgi:amino acid adenylation domain-containing protein/non-ribosomal peptide synthase protein (TIGR01720 family)
MNVRSAHIEDVYELSPLQQGMLFHTLRDPASAMYFHQVAYTLGGGPDVPALRDACQKIAGRHAALRTSFHWEGIERPLQVVHRRAEVPLEELDWRDVPAAEQEDRLRAFLRADQERGFVLTQPPLMRLTLIQAGADTCHLVWSQHHLLWDGWSGPLVLKDLLAYYDAARRSEEVRLPTPRPFRDYIAWLRKQDLRKAEAFWQRELRGVTAPTPLAVDRPAAVRNGQPVEAAEQRLHLPAEFMGSIHEMARRHRVTVNTIIQGAWALLLGRYSGHQSVVFGTSVSGRPPDLPGVEAMVGLFINTLPVRVDLPGAEPVAAWLQGLQSRQAELRQFEYSPLVQVQGWSDMPRGLPLFESMVIFVNYAADRVGHDRFADIPVLGVRQAVQRTDCPLGLVAVPGKELWLRLVYDTGRIDQTAAARMLEHLHTVLADMVSHPEQPLDAIALVGAAERRRVLVEWNATDADFHADRCVHELVATQAARRPDAVALTFQDRRVTYRELDGRANHLANRLRTLGVRLEDRVALCVDRSPDMVIALLAALKAGAVYVPIDPVLPSERQTFMLEDSEVKVILTQEHLRAGLPPFSGPVVCLNAEWPATVGLPDAPASGVGPGNLAYVIYTSGSTGQPKGVLVPHRGLTNVVCAQVRAYGIKPESRVLQVISLSFDVAQAEIFRALVGGATLCLATADDLMPGWPLLNLLRRERITFAGILPAPLAAMPLGEELPDLRALLVGGEQCPVELAAYWGKGRDIFNGYGPTEATVCTTVGTNWDLDRPAPVGRPVANCTVYLLDRALQPVPVGVPGELYIGGVGVTRGYLHQPALTAERFLPDPYSGRPGTRMYRTGDQMRWRSDAQLEFLGRIDGQIKLRGFRIELGEIEAALGQHPEVLHGVVLLREDTPGDKRLVAYVVPQREPGPSAAELRAYLKAKLPEYMVPSAFVFLRELPRTTNDKVDRRLLPPPSEDGAGHGVDFVGPRTPAEELTAGIWADVLKIKRVGVHDNFFELGGHSLSATQAVSRLRSAFQADLPLRALFEAPTVAGLSARVEAARRAAATGRQTPPLGPVGRDGDLPLSFAQQRLWFFDQLEPGNLFYSLPTAIRLTGALYLDALRQALGEIVRRHEVLRTTFANRGGEPVQVIGAAGDVPLPVEDLGGLPEAERDARARDLANEEARRPLDLESGPLVRVRLLRLCDTEHVLLLTMHHIVSDGWSMAIFFRELGTLYEAFSQCRPSPLTELPLQYADYAVWQRGWLRGDVLESQLAYWKKQLEGVTPLELPTDRPRPADQHFEGAHETVRLSLELKTKLEALSRREGVTPFMTLLAAFQVLLSRYASQDDVAVGSPIAGRNQPETEGLVGFFVNTLVMRTDLSGNPTFREVLKRVRATCLGAYDHQDVPFEKLVEELHPHRELGYNPLFQVMFVLQNAPRATRELTGLTLSRLDAGFEPPAKFDLTLGMAENEDGIRTTLKYNAELFDAATVRRMLRHLQILLEGIVAHPEYPLVKLEILAPDELRQVVAGWNATAADFPAGRCVHELFEAQALQRPDATALVFEDRSLTYLELNRCADRLARHLCARGVGPERTVALVADRSPELVVGILGVLKAGGAYVPLDAGQPAQRLAFMVRDAGAVALLTQKHLRNGLPPLEAEVIELEGFARPTGAAADDEPDAPASGVGPGNLAYVIYTSGSTGQPKGVLVPHRGLTNVVCAQNRAFGTIADSRVMQFVMIHFDASQGEIFRTLAVGATLFLARQEDLIPGPDMMRLYRRLGITNATFPTSVMAALPEDEALPDLVQMNVGGEACPTWKAAHWGRGRRFFNGYGPTEATICSTLGTGWEPGRTPPIGRPIANAQAYVLDRNLRPAPVGVPGELFIGGIGVARGYLHRPDLTAAAFLPDPFGGRPGARMYKTGDRVRWLADGQLDFLGRVDEQTKIRGFRVEPGEIEDVLSRHPAVRDCAVAVFEDAHAGKRLVGYVAARHEPPPSVGELRDYLRARLPEYMVPSGFLFLPTVPRKANGKVDRKLLPAPELGRPGDDKEFVGPRSPAEELVATVWADVLRRDRVGAMDNFFDLGGHSLLATQVVSRLRSAFGVEVPLRALFDAPTVAGLAEHIEAARRKAHGVEAPPLRPTGRDAELPLSFAQQRLWFFDQLEPGNVFYVLPSAIRLTGNLSVRALEGALAEVFRRHEVLRTSFPSRDGKALQRISAGGPLALAVTDLTGLPEAEREPRAKALAGEEAGRPFDLAAGPLARVGLLKLGEEDHVLLVTMHHIVSDGWSMAVFFRELATLYAAAVNGEPSPLPELPVQYADFAVWQRGWLQGEVLQRQLAYWRDRLTGVPPLDLPTDRPRPTVHRYRGANLMIPLPAELGAKLHTLSGQEGATLFMTVMAAFQAFLSRYSGQHDVSVGTPIAGRNHPEIEGLIGFFVNTLVIRGGTSGDPTFRDLLRQTRDSCLGAYAHQDLPFEKLVEELQPQRDLARNPLFQVFFAMYEAAGMTRDIAGVSLSRLWADVEVAAKFDLALGLTEGERGLATMLKYNADLFDESTVRRMLEHWQTLLEGIVADPDGRVSELPLSRADERRLMLDAWNRTETPFPEDRCAHQLFEEQAARTPDAPAIVHEDRELSYRELDRRAGRLARRLRAAGVGPEVLVGIFLGRSPETVVSILGVMKAGGAYVPLDPAHPAERLAFLIGDAGVKAIVTQEKLASGLPPHRAPLILLDRDDAPGADYTAGVDSGVGPENLAYVIYTSGSTGRPKGVLVPHRGLVNLIQAHARGFDVRPGDRFLQYAAFNFDISVSEIFRTLTVGACLYMPGPDVLAPGPALLRFLQDKAVTHGPIPPSVLAALPAIKLPALRVVIVGGDSSPPEVVARWAPGRRLFNGYGPTEATICSTLGECRDPAAKLTIGPPIANTRVYVLDPGLCPTPLGVPGELYIGGVGVTRGYLGRPDLTAAAFVPDPFSGRPGARLYRTGDRARWLPCGELEFLGRVDHQVKVRGYRIELGEVEAALGQHPGVKENVVVALEDAPGIKRLVAYLAAAAAPAPTTSELRDFLKDRLPEYMVPSAFVTLAALPRTANGKVDRALLPSPDLSRPELDKEYVAPRNAAEETLAGVWASVLKVGRVGVHDNFFELGGDSILSIQVIARANQAGLRLTAKDLFQHQTIAELAAAAEASGAAPADQGPVAGPVPLTPAQHALLEQDLPEPHHDNRAILLQVRQPLDGGLLDRAFRHVQEHHDALRLRFTREPDGWHQANAGPEAVVGVECVALARVAESEQAAAVEAEATRLQSSLDLAKGPLVRLAYFDGGPDRSGRLLLVAHRLACDAASVRIVLEDLLAAYQQLRRGQPVRLPPKTTSYQQWAQRLVGLAHSDAVDSERTYWLDPSRAEVPGLPADFPGGANTLDSAETVTVELDEEETNALLEEVPQAYRTQTADVLLTALAQAVEGWTGQRALAVDLETSARDTGDGAVDLGRTVGCLDVCYPVVLDLPPSPGPGEALTAVKDRLRAVPDGGLGYGLLRYLGGDEAAAGQFRALPPAPVRLTTTHPVGEGLPAAAPVAPAAESAGAAQSPRGCRRHLFEVAAGTAGGRLRVEWTFSRNRHAPETVRRLAGSFADALRALVAHCRSAEAGGVSASDFPAARATETDLAKLLSRLGASPEGGPA